ncbi:hypothetical protein K523DRAFT_311035 [Schizophyllum commune Tattone D]|nr:hypothetical protein K523DRAFT_311035 [Schizophyllum commune Tattone D]
MFQSSISTLEHDVAALSISDASSSTEPRSAADEDDVLSCADALIRIAESSATVSTQSPLDESDSPAASTTASNHHPSGTSDSPEPSTQDESTSGTSSPSNLLTRTTAYAQRCACVRWQSSPRRLHNLFHYYRIDSLRTVPRRTRNLGQRAQREDEQGLEEADETQMIAGRDLCDDVTANMPHGSALHVSPAEMGRAIFGEERKVDHHASKASQTFTSQVGQPSSAFPCFQPM